MADLATIKDGWDEAARQDAMFNIATHHGRQNGGWTPEEFFAHGQVEIDELFAHLDELGLRGKSRIAALDFGCGVGRLTQALAGEYDSVIGADISDEMIRQARDLNSRSEVEYVNTGASLLDTFPDGAFDLIYTRITLQHMPAELQKGYVGEFVKLLAPDGLAVFQTPEGPEYHHPNEWLSMYGVPRETVEGWIVEAGGKLLDVELLGDPSEQWKAYRYTVTP